MSDVVVVGAGIVGLSTALFLSETGARVVVLEREAIGCAASGGAAGMLSPYYEVNGPPSLDELAQEGLALHRTLAPVLQDETGVDVGFAPLRVLEPAFDEAEVVDLLVKLRQRASVMPELRWADGAEARSLEPRLSRQALGALVGPIEAQVDSYRLTLALAHAAERRGVTMRYAEVVGILRRGQRVAGVRLRHGRLGADRVVLAAGPWTGLMAPWIGQPIPVTPLRGQLLHLRVPGAPLNCCIVRHGNYLLGKSRGLTIAGTTEESVGFRQRPTRAGLHTIIKGALRLSPSLHEARIVHHSACLRPLSADTLPILGPVPGWEGLYLATGHGRRGVLLGLISGRLVAEMVHTGSLGESAAAFASNHSPSSAAGASPPAFRVSGFPVLTA